MAAAVAALFGADWDTGPLAGRQAGWKTVCQEELPLSPKVMRQQFSPEEPGWLSLGLGGIWGYLWGWGGTSHSLPSRYLKSRSADTDNKWECPQGSRHSLLMLPEPPPPSEDSHTQIGRSLAAWQPQGAPKNNVQGCFFTNCGDCWLQSIHSVPDPTLKNVGPRSPAIGAWNEHHCVPNPCGSFLP